MPTEYDHALHGKLALNNFGGIWNVGLPLSPVCTYCRQRSWIQHDFCCFGPVNIGNKVDRTFDIRATKLNVSATKSIVSAKVDRVADLLQLRQQSTFNKVDCIEFNFVAMYRAIRRTSRFVSGFITQSRYTNCPFLLPRTSIVLLLLYLQASEIQPQSPGVADAVQHVNWPRQLVRRRPVARWLAAAWSAIRPHSWPHTAAAHSTAVLAVLQAAMPGNGNPASELATQIHRKFDVRVSATSQTGNDAPASSSLLHSRPHKMSMNGRINNHGICTARLQTQEECKHRRHETLKQKQFKWIK